MSKAIRTARGFALCDFVAILAVAAGAAAMLLLMGSNQQRLARLGEDVAHLKEIGAATGQYTSDNADQFWTFSWRHGQTYQTQFPDLNNAADDEQAAANQAVYLLRTRAGRTDIPVITAWFPHILYSGLVLQDYASSPMPSRMFISSADLPRLQWAADPACFDVHCFSCQPDATAVNKRWPYSASFTPGVAFFDLSVPPYRVTQSGSYNVYQLYPSQTVFGGAQMSGVRFPSQKVLVNDQNARHFGSRQPYCTHSEARLPLLMVDGSVPVRSAADSNPGWDPNQPQSGAVSLQFLYNASQTTCWDPPSISPSGDFVRGRFRYTRGGIAGRDFGGPEVP